MRITKAQLATLDKALIRARLAEKPGTNDHYARHYWLAATMALWPDGPHGVCHSLALQQVCPPYYGALPDAVNGDRYIVMAGVALQLRALNLTR